MAMAGVNKASGGIVTAPRRGPLRVARDLWRAGGTFRGFVEFALVGAIVLAFLPGGGNATKLFRGWQQSEDKGAARGPQGSSAITQPGTKDEALASRPVEKPLLPRISGVTVTAAYFQGIEEPLHSHLLAALEAYAARDAEGIFRALASDDQEDSRVLLMRGLGQLLMPSSDAVLAGAGMLERASAKGEVRATTMLGVLKMTGTAYARDFAAARVLFERAVAGGDGPAARILGDGYLSGYAGSIDPNRAEVYLRLAAERGDVEAMFKLGDMLLTGRRLAKDEAAGERFIQAAAKAGHADAQATMGTMRLKPYLAEATDNPDEALAWYELSAAQGNPRAMFNLGIFYIQLGERAGRLDPARGTELFRLCIEKTVSPQCAFAYATSLDYGLGTARDPVKAYAFYSLAVLVGDKPKAKERRDEIGKTLSAAEKAQAAQISDRTLVPRTAFVEATFKPVPTALQKAHVDAVGKAGNSAASARYVPANPDFFSPAAPSPASANSAGNNPAAARPERLERVFKVQ